MSNIPLSCAIIVAADRKVFEIEPIVKAVFLVTGMLFLISACPNAPIQIILSFDIKPIPAPGTL